MTKFVAFHVEESIKTGKTRFRALQVSLLHVFGGERSSLVDVTNHPRMAGNPAKGILAEWDRYKSFSCI